MNVLYIVSRLLREILSDICVITLLLNPLSGYNKIDAYLLIFCHVIFDVKLSHYVPHTQIIQKTKSKHQTGAVTT